MLRDRERRGFFGAVTRCQILLPIAAHPMRHAERVKTILGRR